MAIRPGRVAPVDPTPVAALARAVLTRVDRRNEWDGRRANGDAEARRALAGKAIPRLEAGDGRNARRILDAVATPFVENWLAEGHESDEDSYLLFRDLGRLMAEAEGLA